MMAPTQQAIGQMLRPATSLCVRRKGRAPLTWVALVVAAMSLVVSALAPQQALAEDDVLSGTPVVRRNLMMRDGRQEIGVTFGTTMGDPYVRNLMPGVRYDLHITDWLSIGADAMVGIAMPTATSDEVEAKTVKSNESFEMEATNLAFLAGARASVAPVAGKFLVGTVPVNFDLHVNLGVGVASVSGTSSIPATISVAPMIGGGMRVFLSKVVAINVDLNDYFVDRTLAVDRNNKAPGTSFATNMMFSTAVTFFLPSSLRRAD
jgi:outer membrane beta-barrel protein